jgi:transposase, IS6 family
MAKMRPALFKGRHFEAEIIILCVRWYLRFALSLRDLEELMAERNLRVDHVTISGGGFNATHRSSISVAGGNFA